MRTGAPVDQRYYESGIGTNRNLPVWGGFIQEGTEPPAPWQNVPVQGGAPGEQYTDENGAYNVQYRQPLDGQADFGPGDGGYDQTPYEQPYNPDDGPREATPGSVGSQPLPQTPNPMTYGPIQQGDVAEGPPTLGDVTMANGGAPTGNGDYIEMPVRPMDAQQPEAPQFVEGSMPDIGAGLKPVWDAAGRVVGYVQDAVNNVVQQAQANMAQNRRNVEDANRATGYGQVSSTPGEPDYVPPDRKSVV